MSKIRLRFLPIMVVSGLLLNITPASAIVNADRELLKNEAYYTASIELFDGENYKTFCSGSLIAPQIILTAAHCILDYDQETAQTWTASFNLPTNSYPKDTRVNIVSAIYHQKYDDSLSTVQINPDGSETVLKEGYVTPGTSEYDADIAILLIETPIYEITPAKMARNTTKIDKSWRVYGWGATKTEMDETSTSLLRTTTVDDATPEMSEYLDDPMENMYAAYSTDEQNNVRTTCWGDSGGPLVDGKGILIGITSFAMVEKCEDIAPTVYTKVASYRSWIYRNVVTINSRHNRELGSRKTESNNKTPILYEPFSHPIKVYGRW
jgi:secreted trypsin-like serine protease